MQTQPITQVFQILLETILAIDIWAIPWFRNRIVPEQKNSAIWGYSNFKQRGEKWI